MIEVEIPELIGADKAVWHVVLAADFGERPRPHTTIPPAKTVEVPGGRGLLTVVDPDAVAASRGQRKHLRRLLTEMRARPELTSGDDDLVIDTPALLIDS